MALAEIEFELSPQQFKMMEYPHLRQGQPLDVQLQTSELLPEPGAEGWYAVRQEPLAPQLVQVGRGLVAFAGQIEAADIVKEEGVETAALLVQCGTAPLRVMCAPQEDGTYMGDTLHLRHRSSLWCGGRGFCYRGGGAYRCDHLELPPADSDARRSGFWAVA
jgi:hypothetical protein